MNLIGESSIEEKSSEQSSSNVVVVNFRDSRSSTSENSYHWDEPAGSAADQDLEQPKQSAADTSSKKKEYSKEEQIRVAKESGMRQEDFERIYEIQM